MLLGKGRAGCQLANTNTGACLPKASCKALARANGSCRSELRSATKKMPQLQDRGGSSVWHPAAYAESPRTIEFPTIRALPTGGEGNRSVPKGRALRLSNLLCPDETRRACAGARCYTALPAISADDCTLEG